MRTRRKRDTCQITRDRIRDQVKGSLRAGDVASVHGRTLA